MSNNISGTIDASNRDALNFYSQFYRALDTQRHNLPQYLRADSAIVWNGSPIGGVDAFISMYSKMPETQHEVTCFDVQPVALEAGADSKLLLTTSGKVKLGTERAKNLFGFASTFLLKHDPSTRTLVISSCSYRLVHKPEDSTLA